MKKENPTIVFKHTKTVDIEYLDFPQPKEGEVLLKTLKTMISIGTELTVLKGENIEKGSEWDKLRKFPHRVASRINLTINKTGVVVISFFFCFFFLSLWKMCISG